MVAAAPARGREVGRPRAAQGAHRRRPDDDRQFHPDRLPAAASAAGTLQLKRPGRVRFQYGSGDLLLVADGKTLTFVDYQVGQKSSWPLGQDAAWRRCFRALPTSTARLEILPSNDPRVVVARATNTGAIRAADARLPAQPLGARRPAAVRLDGDRSAEPADHGQAVQRALQCRRPGQRLHLRRAEEAIG